MHDYFIHLATMFSIYAILGLSLNLVVGYTGLLSVTHAAFYGIGAYTTAILLTKAGFNFFLALIIGVLVTIIVSLLIGLILSKFQGDYYALVSFGFNIIVFSIFLNWQSLTRGALGIPGIARPNLLGLNFSSNFVFLILSLFIVALVFLVSRFIINSSFGRVLKSIREDEKALQVFGYKTHYFKLAIFVIAAGMAAIAGSLFASYITYISPVSFTLIESIFILTIIIFGGLANLRGSIAGALILIILPELLRFIGFPTSVVGHMRQLTYGIILILLMLYRPQGLLGEYKL